MGYIDCVVHNRIITNNTKARPGVAITPLFIVVHYTGNEAPGADDLANAAYFQKQKRLYVSAHFTVDQDSITKIIPENEMAFHCGAVGGNYTPFAKANLMHPIPNKCTIGIEWCVNKGNNFWRTYHNVVMLCAELCVTHNLTVDNIITHHAVTGKSCPKFFVDDAYAIKLSDMPAKKLHQHFLADIERILNRTLVILDDKPICEALNINGTTFASIRQLAEALQLELAYDAKYKKVILKRR